MTYRQRKARRRGRRGARRNPALLVVFVPLLILGIAMLSVVGYVIAIVADAARPPGIARGKAARHLLAAFIHAVQQPPSLIHHVGELRTDP